MAVSSALHDMVQMLNQLLENSLSVRSWRWRLEAWRTNKPLAEVVLLRTLVYAVEQVLLVDRNSGLLIASVSAAGITPKDDALVSGMLVAIQEFMQDSFQLQQDQGIREIHTGDFSLWVEPGPYAALAAVVRGNAPVELREILRAARDLIHQEMGEEIRQFHGDSKPFENRCRPILEGCLQSQRQIGKPRSYWRVWVCAGMVGAAAAGWGGLRIWQAHKWNQAVGALRQTPGIAITQSARGSRTLEGLRDPFAVSAESVLAKNGISARGVSMHFQPFLSLDPRLLERRARATLHAPDSISVSLDGGVLRLAGAASHAWIVNARNAGEKLALAGIREVNTEDVQDQEMEARRSEIEGMRILFGTGSSDIAGSETRVVDGVAAKLKEWIAGARAIGRTPRVEVVGHTDLTGSDATNSDLSRQRALRVVEMLRAEGVPSVSLVPVGAGPQEGGEARISAEAADALRRSVVFRLSPDRGAGSQEAQ